MRWFKPNLKSIHALFGFGHPPTPDTTVLEFGIEDIRAAMLALIEDADAKEHPHVERRIRYAIDVLALWYLRGDLMALLASRYGEAGARERLEPISEMFGALLPQGLRSRPSPLGGAKE